MAMESALLVVNSEFKNALRFLNERKKKFDFEGRFVGKVSQFPR